MKHPSIRKMLASAAAAAALVLVLAGNAGAQILPPVQLPGLPGLPTEELNRTLDGVRRTADPGQLRDLRRLQIRELLRTNRRVLERDPRGEPIVRNEVVALSPAPEALQRARAAGFSIGRTRALEGLDTTIVVLIAPPGMSTRRALQRLREADPDGIYDFNHLYLGSGDVGADATAQPAAPSQAVRPDLTTAKVGLIDGGVDRSHRVFQGVVLHENGCAGGTVPSSHGTAVASLLAGHGDEFAGAAAGAQIYAADVYCGLPTGGAVDAVADAFGWLSRERVPVMNISLVGPPNALLQQLVRIVTSRGHVVVAAVGNDGPSAPPLYPAAYPEVIAVTGVDARQRVLIEACRGKHVDFAAPGADMSAAALENKFAVVRGTSFAAPIVAGLLARALVTPNAAASSHTPDKQRVAAAIATLTSQAIDLGAAGPDKIYGNGLIGDALRPPQKLASK